MAGNHRGLLVSALLCAAFTSALRADLISHWTFDATLEDGGGNENHGEFFGDAEPLFVDGHDGTEDGAIEFDGVDDYVLVAHNEGLPLYQHPQFSIALWVRGGPQTDKRVWSESSPVNNAMLFNLGTQSGGTTGQLDLFVRDAANIVAAGHVLSSGTPFDGTWHHIAYLDDSGTATVYIDGQPDPAIFSYGRPDLTTGDPAFALENTTIGGILRAATCCHFLGAIDDVRVYDHLLSEEEIADLVARDVECPDAGDTHCGSLVIESAPKGGGPGAHTLRVDGATDDSGDAIAYRFEVEDELGGIRVFGPQTESSFTVVLTAGAWTIRAHVDDDSFCPDAAPDSVCELAVEVEAPPPRLIAHFPLDGDLEDASGNGNHGSPFTGVEPEYIADRDGVEPGAARFNGFDDLVVVEPANGLPLYHNPVLTIALWVRGLPQPDFRVWSESSTANRTPLFNIGTQNLGTTGQADIFVRAGDGSTPVAHRVSTMDAFDGEWHHLAWVDDNGSAVLYIDGEPDLTDFNYVRPQLDVDTTTIGGILRDVPSHWFSGDIDDVRAYNYALSQEEIVEILEGGPAPAQGFVRGDSNSDGSINITDGINVLGFLFLGGEAPACADSADADDTGVVAITDAIAVFNFLFLGGSAPLPPSPSRSASFPAEDCGEDPTADALGCAAPPPVCVPVP